MPSPSLAEPLIKRRGVPTSRLVGLAGAVVGVSVLVPLVGGGAVVWWAVVTLCGALLAVDLLARPPRGAVSVSRHLRSLYHVGREGTYEVVVENLSGRALAVELEEVLPPELEGEGLSLRALMPPGARLRREVRFVGLSRGEHRLLPLGVRFGHPLGLLAYQHQRELGDAALVIPGRPAGETEWLLSQAAAMEEMGQKRIRRRGAEREFESLREYAVGDPVRKIDWKSSARRMRPLVKQFETERNAEVIVALDCGRLMGSLIDGVPKLDLALTPVLDLCAVALRRGERVGFLAFDSRARSFVPPRSGLTQLSTILEASARLPPASEPTSYLRAVRYLEAHHRKRCLLLVFTDFTDELSAQEMYASLAALTRRHVLIFVAVGDPHLQRIYGHRTSDAREVFQKAIAGQLLGERRRVLASMERLGIFTVDAEPRRLTGPLISRYLEVRLRGVL